jgi:hypothetical protein
MCLPKIDSWHRVFLYFSGLLLVNEKGIAKIPPGHVCIITTPTTKFPVSLDYIPQQKTHIA